ncbi:MAG: RNA-binding transcriptional accessory protein [Lachnospiraceae bacterium]|nr:RNA-binding transcriptional accessory protein [Lachnospiraceae bacterium]
MDISLKIAEELKIKKSQVDAAVGLIDEGNTIPFIARYRKEVTGSLNDEQLRSLHERLVYLRNLEEKKASYIASIDEQGKLTDELKAKIEAAEKLVTLEDLYRPYKQKKKTRASAAKARGLEPLAEYILAQNAAAPVEEEAVKYVTGKITPENDTKEAAVKAAEKEVPDTAAAIAGACDIIAERVSDDADVRSYLRDLTVAEGNLVSVAKDAEAESVYTNYYDYSEPVSKVVGHRILAINRGEAEKILTVSVQAPAEKAVGYLEKKYITSDNEYTTPLLKATVQDAYDRLIAPAVERDIRSDLTSRAEDGAIDVFGKNLKQLLMQPPIAGCTVLGWDPAFRTGCKLSIVDPTGKVLDTRVIYPTEPQNKVEESKNIVKVLIKKYGVNLISVGNGTASRESEAIIAEIISEIPESHVQYVITNEAGASVYSASALATEEFPNFDVGQRSATSIARRVQDPLAELVKIDPQSIGVGQYQHDCDQKKLAETLGGVVEDAVNSVGVDLNTASAALLKYVSGVSAALAKNIVTYREENGRFESRAQLKKVPKLGPKAFEQCAGFLRINGGKDPLDQTSVHPESYEAARKLLDKMGCEIRDEKSIKAYEMTADKVKLSEELGIGEITLTDIFHELEKPGRDPREDMPKPVLRSDVLDIKDLKPGMILKGTVRNVIDFGAFVDIGVHQDGLVHISRMTDHYIKHPLEVVSVGDIVEVRVVDVDPVKQRISLSMRLDDDGSGEKKVQGAGAPKNNAPRSDGSGRPHGDRQDRPHRDHGDRPRRDDRKSTGRSEEFAPGTIGYMLAHQKKK